MARVDDRTKDRRQRFVEKYIELFDKVGEDATERSRLNSLRELVDRLIKEWNLDVTSLQIKVRIFL